MSDTTITCLTGTDSNGTPIYICPIGNGLYVSIPIAQTERSNK